MDLDSNEIAPRKRGMTPLRLALSAGVERRVVVDGDWIHGLEIPTGDLTIRFDDSEAIPLNEGIGFRRYYREIAVTSTGGQDIILLVGFGSVFDARNNVTANVAPGNTFRKGGDVACADGAATLLLAEATDRSYAFITNPSTNFATVRIGPGTVDATSGVPLEPGQTLPVATTAAIYAYNDSGSSVTLSATQIAQV